MPEQTFGVACLENVLECLEDNSLSKYQARSSNYQNAAQLLKNKTNVSASIVNRLLEICIKDLKEDMQYAAVAINVISVILQNYKPTEYASIKYLPIALAVLNIIKTTALISKVQSLQIMYFKTFLEFPDETIRTIGSEHSGEILEMFNLYLHAGIPNTIKYEPFNILYKLLKTLAPDKRLNFVKEGLNTWFSKILPNAINAVHSDNQMAQKVVDTLQLLTDDLVKLEYSENAAWLKLLESIYKSTMYPAVMKSMLDQKSPYWHIIWGILVRLLKHQITTNIHRSGSPINSLLPVVEAAFKNDPVNRCRAFDCWNILIDNLSTETNESFISKRIKLLIIPLKSNNAKIDTVALAKFNTWWHLLYKFNNRLENFFDLMVLPFLQFCFGKPNTDSCVLVPGLAFPEVTKKCVNAFIEICCQNDEDLDGLPRLQKKLLSCKALLGSTSDWMHCLKVFITTLHSNQCEISRGKEKCELVWRSFVELGSQASAEDKKRLLSEFFAFFAVLEENCNDVSMLRTVFTMYLSLLHDNNLRRNLLMNYGDKTSYALRCIVDLVTIPSMQNLYPSQDGAASVAKLKPVANIICADIGTSQNDMIQWLLQVLTPNDSILMLWTALLETVKETKVKITTENISNILLWPLQHIEKFENVDYAASVWNTCYEALQPKLANSTIVRDITILLMSKKTKPNNLFALYALLQIIREGSDKGTNCTIETELLADNLTKLQEFSDLDSIFGALVNTVASMLINVLKVKCTTFADHTFKSTATTLNMILKSPSPDIHRLLVDRLLVKLEQAILNNNMFDSLISSLVEPVIMCTKVYAQHEQLVRSAFSLLTTFTTKSNALDKKINTKVNKALDNIKVSNPEYNSIKNTEPINKFTSPKAVKVLGKIKKKEPSIVNTVVEDGEEFTVVKSNWKFNPRKLTENQKEKLLRKREDIPALYQDLSQSQDEFRLSTWKTDSQDTSLSSSKSNSKAAADEISSTLSKMANADVVPKIMENILSPKANKNVQPAEASPAETKTKPATPKQKGPRVALKDRVFQNVRNLIEKSIVPSDALSSKDLNKTVSEDVTKTPPPKPKNDSGETYSAPPKISTDRPSRVKRKPKKYDLEYTLSSTKKAKNDTDVEVHSDSNSSDKKYGQETVSKNVDNNDLRDPPKAEKEQDQKKPTEPVKETDLEKTIDDVQNVFDQDVTNCQIIVLDEDSLSPSEKNKEVEKTTETKLLSLKNSDENVSNNGTKNKLKDVETTGPKLNEMNVPPNKKDDRCEVQNESKGEAKHAKNTTDVAKTVEVNTKEKVVKPVNVPDSQDCSTPKTPQDKKINRKARKPRIVKELAIDMVEGNPFLSDERTTRKTAVTPTTKLRRKPTPKTDEKAQIKSKKTDAKLEKIKKQISVSETQESSSFESVSTITDDVAMSEDFIESSQDSTLTTISVKSNKSAGRRSPRIAGEVIPGLRKSKKKRESQSILDECPNKTVDTTIDDIELSRNKSLPGNNTTVNLTADLDTEPMDDKITSSDDVILLTDDPEPIVVSSNETQDIASADTEPMDVDNFAKAIVKYVNTTEHVPSKEATIEPANDENVVQSTTHNDLTVSLHTTADLTHDKDDATSGLSSPFKDSEQRNQDFLNNTLEISPIKAMSPVPEAQKTTPPRNNDYVVVKLSSPVQPNGEPFNKSTSPEVFTDDKLSPDKRNESPPREDIVSTNNNSPSSSLSLKKKPQVRTGGRGAQMLGLCVTNRLQMNDEKSDEARKDITPAKRNLRMVYNSGDNQDNGSDENEEVGENFLKFKRTLPAAESSPSGPILKRKLIEIADEATCSPASKRKRVSFHDPPVSTTVSVHKYIEPLGVRSPQSVKKHQGCPGSAKMRKKLDSIFKLDTALARTLEDIYNMTDSEDTEMSSLEPTLSVEVVKTHVLNDKEPICVELVNCKDPISNIATELSSPAMKSLLLKELEGKIETIGDLAKMSELEINRLCIKAPKIKVAKKVLTDYAEKILKESQDFGPIEQTFEAQVHCSAADRSHIEIQTDVLECSSTESQTNAVSLTNIGSQTAKIQTNCKSVQTNETGSKSTKDVISTCLDERTDFIGELKSNLDEGNKLEICKDLTPKTLTNMLCDKLPNKNAVKSHLKAVLNRPDSKSIIQEYLKENFTVKDILLLCSDLLKSAHDKS